MSQQKVNKYKEEKANRQKLIKKERRMRVLRNTVVALVLVALVGWFVVSLVRGQMAKAGQAATPINVTSIDNFLGELDSYTAE